MTIPTLPLPTPQYHSVPEPYRSVLYSLQLRKAFGGMGGDMVMLDGATRAVCSRSME